MARIGAGARAGQGTRPRAFYYLRGRGSGLFPGRARGWQVRTGVGFGAGPFGLEMATASGPNHDMFMVMRVQWFLAVFNRNFNFGVGTGHVDRAVDSWPDPAHTHSGLRADPKCFAAPPAQPRARPPIIFNFRYTLIKLNLNLEINRSNKKNPKRGRP